LISNNPVSCLFYFIEYDDEREEEEEEEEEEIYNNVTKIK